MTAKTSKTSRSMTMSSFRKKEETDNTDDLSPMLFDAISEGNFRSVNGLLGEAIRLPSLIMKKDPQGLTPLKKSIAMSKGEIARLLVAKGASPSVRDPLGKTPLHNAVTMGRRDLMAPLLVSHDSSVNIQDNAGWTPLHYALKGNHLKAIEWLLYAGADVNLKNKDDESPMELAEEDSLVGRMFKYYNVDRELYPVSLSSAYISRKTLNYIGTDGMLMFVTSNRWSPNEQFFFCKRVRPSEATPPIPLRWNEFYYSDVYHYRTMRRLGEGENRVKLYLIYFEELKFSEIVLKVTSKDRFLGEVPMTRSTYIQEKYTNFMGTCELDIKAEGQFVVVKRAVALKLRKNTEGVLAHPKFPDFLIDLPSGGVHGPPKDWNASRLARAVKERDGLVKAARLAQEEPGSATKIDFWIEFCEQTADKDTQPIESGGPATLTRPDRLSQPNPSILSASAGQDGHESDSAMFVEDPNVSPEQRVSMYPSLVESERELEPMLEAYEEDECEDFYYISRGWGLYLTVMWAMPLPVILETSSSKDKESPLRATTNFFHLTHTANETNSKSDCIIQIPKTDQFEKVGTVLVFARQPVDAEEESPDPDDSSQEYLLSNDMKNSWGSFWLNQEKERWALIATGICNRRTRVIFKTRQFRVYIVVQLNSGNEKAEKEEDDEDSSDEEGGEVTAGEGEDEGGEHEESTPHPELQEEKEVSEETSETKRKRKLKKRAAASPSSIRLEGTDLCMPDESESEEESLLQEGEGEGEDEDKVTTDTTKASVAAEGTPAVVVEDTEEPGAPAPSPMVQPKEEKDENASNMDSAWGQSDIRTDSNNNSSRVRNQQDPSGRGDRNNNQIRDNDENVDQSELAPEERTVVVGPPALSSSFAKLEIAPSVYRPMSKGHSEGEDGAEHTDIPDETPQDIKSSMQSGTYPTMPEDDGMAARLGGADDSDEELPELTQRKLSIATMKNGVKKLQDFKFGPKLSTLQLPGVDMDQVKHGIAQMWRYRNHKSTCILIFTKLRTDGAFDVIFDIVQERDIYIRAESHYSVGYKMVGESAPMPIKSGRLLSFSVDGPINIESCTGGVPNAQGTLRTRTLFFSHSQINSLEYVVRRPVVEEAKGPAKRGKKKEEVKVDQEPDAKLEVTGFNAGSGTNGVDLTALNIFLTGADLWEERHVALRASDNNLLNLLIECLSKSRALARKWWRFIILLGYPEKEVEGQKGKTPGILVVKMFVKKWFEDNLNEHDRGILKLVACLNVLELDIAMDNVVRIIKLYKTHLLLEPVRPRYLRLLFHWVLQTKITKNNLLRLPDPQILRPVSDVFLLHLSDFLPKEHLFKIGASMEVEDNVLHAISGEEIITDEAYLAFRVLVKSRQKKDEIIHYTLLLMEMCKNCELPDAQQFIIKETKKWMVTVAETDPEVCAKLENVFS